MTSGAVRALEGDACRSPALLQQEMNVSIAEQQEPMNEVDPEKN
ncbi:MAG: hypothetical protein JWQ42_1357 [Edaphobacter sp.]|nr:hypothetical protein [Edaphobacter sp.]